MHLKEETKERKKRRRKKWRRRGSGSEVSVAVKWCDGEEREEKRNEMK